MGHRQKKKIPSSVLLLTANRASQVGPESPSLFLLTSPGHNSNNCPSFINKISSTSYYNVKNLPIWSVILCWSLIYFWTKPPCGLQFEYGLIFETGKYEPFLAIPRAFYNKILRNVEWEYRYCWENIFKCKRNIKNLCNFLGRGTACLYIHQNGCKKGPFF